MPEIIIPSFLISECFRAGMCTQVSKTYLLKIVGSSFEPSENDYKSERAKDCEYSKHAARRRLVVSALGQHVALSVPRGFQSCLDCCHLLTIRRYLNSKPFTANIRKSLWRNGSALGFGWTDLVRFPAQKCVLC